VHPAKGLPGLSRRLPQKPFSGSSPAGQGTGCADLMLLSLQPRKPDAQRRCVRKTPAAKSRAPPFAAARSGEVRKGQIPQSWERAETKSADGPGYARARCTLPRDSLPAQGPCLCQSAESVIGIWGVQHSAPRVFETVRASPQRAHSQSTNPCPTARRVGERPHCSSPDAPPPAAQSSGGSQVG